MDEDKYGTHLTRLRRVCLQCLSLFVFATDLVVHVGEEEKQVVVATVVRRLREGRLKVAHEVVDRFDRCQIVRRFARLVAPEAGVS